MSQLRNEPWLFEIRLRRKGKRYLLSTAWLGQETAERNIDFEGLRAELAKDDVTEALRRNLRPRQDPGPLGSRSGQRVVELGQRLFERLLKGSALTQLRGAVATLERSGRVGVLRWRIPAERRFQEVAWELLCDPASGQPFAVCPRWTVVRVLGLADSEAARPVVRPIRLLVAVAQPRGLAALDVEGELRVLEQALDRPRARGWLSVEILRHASRHAVRDRLRSGKFDALHFLGHGEAATTMEEACLALEGEEGSLDAIGGSELAALLGLRSDLPSALSFVVLNACYGGQASEGRLYSGVAQRLLQAGLPAVVAMPRPILDADAIRFAGALYESLATGAPLEGAMAIARRQLFAEQSGAEWAVPVLFSHGTVSRAAPRRPRPWTGRLLGLVNACWVRRPRARWKRLPIWARPVALGLSLVLVAGAALLLGELSRPKRLPPPPPGLFEDDARCPSPQGLSLGLRWVEPGSFEMGSDATDGAAPQHHVTLTEPFCLARTELTAGQWGAIVGSTSTRQTLLSGPEEPQSLLPMGGLTFEQAEQILARLNELAGTGAFFLPTEAQWEYVARAGSVGTYSFGDDPTQLPRFANCGPKNRDGDDGVARVAAYEPNDWGFYDMQGNLTEWVSDWHAPYSPEAVTDPTGQAFGLEKVRRGGSYRSMLWKCGVAYRATAKPTTSFAEFGLRVARRALP